MGKSLKYRLKRKLVRLWRLPGILRWRWREARGKNKNRIKITY